jgi:hypothetical protein
MHIPLICAPMVTATDARSYAAAVTVELAGRTVRISGEGQGAELSEHDFVEATVGRLADGAALPARLRAMLCCLA